MIIKVSREDRHGRQLDHREAQRRIGRTARYLGSKPTHYVFETPDPTSCAICVTGAAPYSLQQLDEGGPLVAVCRSCNEDRPVAKHGTERGYEAPGGLLSIEQSRAGARRAVGAERYERDNRVAREAGMKPSRALSPGEVATNRYRFEKINRLAKAGRLPRWGRR